MPIQLIWGDDDFNIDEKLNEIKKSILNNDINPLNYRKIDNPPFLKLDEVLRTQGMMFGNILFVINANKYFLNEGKTITLSDKEADDLVKGIENVSDFVHIVFVCRTEANSNKKPDSRKKLYKAVAKFGTVEEFPMLKVWETQKAVSWVQMRAKKMKLEIAPKLAEKLVDITGVSYKNLNNNLEKLVLSAYPNKTVTEEMLSQFADESANVFKILDLIMDKKNVEALSEISILSEKQNPLIILAFLQTAITRMLQTKIYSKNYSTFDISRKIGQHEFVVKQNLQKVRNMSTKELVKIKQSLTDIEYKIKTGEVSDFILALSLEFNGGEDE